MLKLNLHELFGLDIGDQLPLETRVARARQTCAGIWLGRSWSGTWMLLARARSSHAMQP